MDILNQPSKLIVQPLMATLPTSNRLQSTATTPNDYNMRMRPHGCAGAPIGSSTPYISPAHYYRQSMPLLLWPLLQLLRQSADLYHSHKSILLQPLYVVYYGLAAASHAYFDRFNVPRLVTVLPHQSRLQSSGLQPPLHFTFLANFLSLQPCPRGPCQLLLSILRRPSLLMLPNRRFPNP